MRTVTSARPRVIIDRNVEVTWKFSRTILVRNSSGQTSSIAHHREKRKEIKSINKHSTTLFTLWVEKTIHHKPKGVLIVDIETRFTLLFSSARMQSLRSLLSVSLLVALPTLFLQSANGAPFHRNSLSVPSLTNGRSELFGVSKISRGGAEEGADEEVVETLYLPGLLDAELSSSSQVRNFCI